MENKVINLRVSFVFQFFALFVLIAGSVHAQSNNRLVEINPETKHVQVAPVNCLKTLRAFVTYIKRTTPDISDDKSAQLRWLTEDLRDAMGRKMALENEKAKQRPTDKREFPDNGSFVGAWDYPSTYSIVGSRRYDKVAIVDIEYKWGPGTNYEGDKRLRSFIFLNESGVWRLDDIYDFQGESLKSYFLQTY